MKTGRNIFDERIIAYLSGILAALLLIWLCRAVVFSRPSAQTRDVGTINLVLTESEAAALMSALIQATGAVPFHQGPLPDPARESMDVYLMRARQTWLDAEAERRKQGRQ